MPVVKFEVRDYIRDYADFEFARLQKYSFMLDLALYAFLVYWYIYNSENTFSPVLKMTGIIIVLRYLFSVFTDYQIIQESKNKKYFQLNLYLAIFTLVILSMQLDRNTTMGVIGGYFLASSSVGNNMTIDNLFTVLVSLVLFQNRSYVI